MLRNLALLLVATFVSLGLAEAAVRLGLVPLGDYVLSDAWWKERWFRERRGMNPREFVVLDPELGYIPAANLRDLPYQGVRISTNSAHMRGRQEIEPGPGEGLRVVASGDSFTFGQCVNDDETWPAVMGRALDAEVANLGVMGYGQDQALLRLRRDGFPYEPDAVVFGFHSSNMRRNLLSFRGYGKPRFELVGGRLELRNVPVPAPESFDRWWPPRLWNHVLIHRDSRLDRKLQKRAIEDLSAAIVHQMAVDVQAAGARLYVVHLPHPNALEGAGEHGWSWMEKFCAAPSPAPFRCVSPVPRFREIAPTREARRKHFDCHFSKELYAAVGEVVADAVLRDLPPALRPDPPRAVSRRP